MVSFHVLVTLVTAALRVAADSGSAFKTHHVAALRRRTPDVVTDNVVLLERSSVASKSSRFLHSMLRRDMERAGNSKRSAAQLPLTEVYLEGWTVDVAMDGHNYTLLLDTGASDLWVAADNFTCVDTNRKPVEVSGYEGTTSWYATQLSGKTA